MPKGSVKGGVIVDGRMFEVTIPAELLKLYQGKPRIVLGRLEWYGIHPLPIEVLAPELRTLGRQFEIFAVPKGMMG